MVSRGELFEHGDVVVQRVSAVIMRQGCVLSLSGRVALMEDLGRATQEYDTGSAWRQDADLDTRIPRPPIR